MARKKKRTGKKAQQATGSSRAEWYALTAVVGLTLVLFWRCTGFDFTNWDDPVYILENQALQAGDWGALVTGYFSGNFHPLTMLSYGVDHAIAGNAPWIYHTTNVLLHLVNVALVFFLVTLLYPRLILKPANRTVITAASITALIFGVHPMHIESVAWISERKDLLYSLFYILSLILYLRFLKKRSNGRYLLILVSFILALLSKAMAVSLPVLMLALDVVERRPVKRAVIEKIPLFVLSGLFGIVSILAQSSSAAISDTSQLPWLERIQVIAYGFVTYIERFIVPHGMAGFHPYPSDPSKGFEWTMWLYVAGAIILALIAIRVFQLSARREAMKPFAFGAAFYTVTVALVLQLIPVGNAIIADRYTYLPYIGLGLIVSHGLVMAMRSEKFGKPVAVVVGLWCLFLFAASWSYLPVWENSNTMWSRVIELYPKRAPVAFNNRGNYYARRLQEYDLALEDYDQVVKIDPDYEDIYINRGNTYGLMQNYTASIEDYRRSIEMGHSKDKAYTNLVLTYANLGQWASAYDACQQLLELRGGAFASSEYRMYEFLGIAAFNTGRTEQSVEALEKAIAHGINPGRNHFNLAKAYERLGNSADASEHYKLAAQLGYSQ